MSEEDQRGWAGLGARFLTIRSRGSVAVPGELVDAESVLGPWFEKTAHARVIVLRPDRLVAAADSTGLSVPRIGVPAATAVR